MHKGKMNGTAKKVGWDQIKSPETKFGNKLILVHFVPSPIR